MTIFTYSVYEVNYQNRVCATNPKQMTTNDNEQNSVNKKRNPTIYFFHNSFRITKHKVPQSGKKVIVQFLVVTDTQCPGGYVDIDNSASQEIYRLKKGPKIVWQEALGATIQGSSGHSV